MQHYDLIVIGSGPGGQRAAIQAAKCGKRVGLIERQSSIGGTRIGMLLQHGAVITAPFLFVPSP
jgi:pyruvate/2-oxoglutarate dehydrogenase complex dihydrolipoamide dehydrogenase (E3) component